MKGVLAKVMRRIDEGQFLRAAEGGGALGQLGGFRDDIGHHVVEMDAMRPGARGDAAGVRTHVAHTVVAGDLDELGIPTGPRVID